MSRFDTAEWMRRAEAPAARLFFAWQLLRLRIDRAVTAVVRGRRPRVMATACWSFPIYSQTFVYQELTQLIRGGFAVRFVYSHLSDDPLPPQFKPLWRARRRLTLHPVVCDESLAYYTARMPERVAGLVDMLCAASGLTPRGLTEHKHFRQAFAFTRTVEAYAPAYLHSCIFYEGSLFALIASLLLDIPRGVSCYADHMLADYELKVVPLHLRRCTLAIATSARIKRELLQIAPQTPDGRVLVKPNGIDTSRFPAVARIEPRNGEPFSLVSVCRIEPKKGLVYLIEALGQLRSRNINLRLHVIGGIDNSDASRDYHRLVSDTIARLGLGHAVHLEGIKSEADINAIFRTSHIFVAPFVETDGGDKDGIPTAVLEGMAAGLPMLATNAGSILEVVDDGIDGVIVPQRDAGALALAIDRLLADPNRRADLGSAAARSVRRRFDASICERSFHDQLRTLLAQGANPGGVR